MDKKHVWIIALVVAVAFGFFAGAAFAVGHKGSTLNAVQGRGVLRAGVLVYDIPGFVEHPTTPESTGFEPELARAVAAAVLGDSNAVELVQTDIEERFSLLDNNKIDVSFTLVTWNSQRDMLRPETKRGYEIGPIYYYDGTSIMLNTDENPDPLNIIVDPDSSNFGDLQRYIDSGSAPTNWTIVTDEAVDLEVAQNAFIAGSYKGDDIHGLCTDQSGLIALRYGEIQKSTPGASDWYLYPDDENALSISKSPLAVTVSEGDTNWAEVVTWVIYALLEAEEQGYSSANAATIPDGWSPTIPGLPDNWARTVIQQVGNYDEIFQRNLGPIGFSRGQNRLWKDGGLMYSYPF